MKRRQWRFLCVLFYPRLVPTPRHCHHHWCLYTTSTNVVKLYVAFSSFFPFYSIECNDVKESITHYSTQLIKRGWASFIHNNSSKISVSLHSLLFRRTKFYPVVFTCHQSSLLMSYKSIALFVSCSWRNFLIQTCLLEWERGGGRESEKNERKWKSFPVLIS